MPWGRELVSWERGEVGTLEGPRWGWVSPVVALRSGGVDGEGKDGGPQRWLRCRAGRAVGSRPGNGAAGQWHRWVFCLLQSLSLHTQGPRRGISKLHIPASHPPASLAPFCVLPKGESRWLCEDGRADGRDVALAPCGYVPINDYAVCRASAHLCAELRVCAPGLPQRGLVGGPRPQSRASRRVPRERALLWRCSCNVSLRLEGSLCTGMEPQ